MVGVPVAYRDVRERIMASYDFADIAAGTGMIGFRLFGVSSGATLLGGLINTATLHSHDIAINYGSGAGTETSHFANWDTSIFQVQTTFEGDYYVDIAFDNTAAPSTSWIQVSGAAIQRVDANDVVTELAQITYGSQLVDTTNKTEGGILVRGNISGATTFKVGEKLRIRTEIRVAAGAGGTSSYDVGIDPANRTKGSFEYTDSTVFMPQKIQL